MALDTEIIMNSNILLQPFVPNLLFLWRINTKWGIACYLPAIHGLGNPMEKFTNLWNGPDLSVLGDSTRG